MNETELMTIDNLNLVVNEMTIGTLITNAQDVHANVVEFLKTCDVENYKGTAKDAANDKAKFNTLAKKLNDERIRLEREFLKPFEPFREIVKETTEAIKKVSSGLDQIVKAKEREEKDAKRAEIAEIWKVYEFNLVPLEKIFNEKWLNKTYKAKQIHDDIAHIIDRITGDLQSIEQFGEDTSTLKELYLSTLDLQSTLCRGAEFRENRKRLAEEESRKAQAETKDPQKEIHEEPAQAQPCKYEPSPEMATESPKNEAPLETTFCFFVTMPIADIAKECGIESEPILMRATAAQIQAFKAKMEQEGYTYTKSTYNGRLLLVVHAK